MNVSCSISEPYDVLYKEFLIYNVITVIKQTNNKIKSETISSIRLLNVLFEKDCRNISATVSSELVNYTVHSSRVSGCNAFLAKHFDRFSCSVLLNVIKSFIY